jgi:polysaccharide pyruvyl transferase WcaK-like protein
MGAFKVDRARNSKRSILFGFDFYGAGNIGDDLMLAGYLEPSVTPDAATSGSCKLVSTQKDRFPSVTWFPRNSPEWNAERRRLISSSPIWLGVGDTPFQLSSGDWSVNHLIKETRCLEGMSDTPMLMIGVGAETAIEKAQSALQPVLDRVDYIWARDSHSAEILCKIGLRSEKISVASDLAHISLSMIFPTPLPSTHRDIVAINYFSERPEASDLEAIRLFSLSLNKTEEVVYASTEARKKMERRTYNRIYRISPLSLSYHFKPSRPLPAFVSPDYSALTVRELISPITMADTVLSSRYHGVLAAAWAGRRVGVFGGRSSKVDELAKELGRVRQAGVISRMA